MPLLLDKKAQQEHTKKDSPFYINRKSPSYAKLQHMLSNTDHIFIREYGRSKEEITFIFDTVSQQLSLEDIGKACPLLKNTLIYNLSLNTKYAASDLGKIAKIIWQHCENPGVQISADMGSDVYAKELTEITHIGKSSQLLICTGSRYILTLGEQDDILDQIDKDGVKKRVNKKTCVSVNAGNDKLPITNLRISISALENLYPGFTERLKMATSLGLSSSEIATFALDTTYRNENAQSQEESVILPTSYAGT